jgi:hypothetical protein
MADNQQLTETNYHTVGHDVIAIVCTRISLLEVKVVILVFGCLAQFMKCDKPHNKNRSGGGVSRQCQK